ncbi:50S ribosomal protein L40e [Candidatus Woesearchaeota archaeon]|nr:50S ribosomal protein L40e [Candidatus Woesearchaeota archaeon]
MTKFPEAAARLFRRVYVCRKCKNKQKADVLKVLEKTVSCRRCGSKRLRPIKSKK